MSDTSGTATYGTVAVGATALLIVDGTTTRETLFIHNAHATQVLYIGDDTSVATTTGLPVLAGQRIELQGYNGPVYGIASGAATDTRFFETGT